MARGCCDCTWRCPLYDSEKCAPCRYDAEAPNFEREEHPGYGTKAAAALPKENKHMKAFKELIDKSCGKANSYIPILPKYDFDPDYDSDPFKRD